MWRKHKKELLFCFFFPIVVIVVLFTLVTTCEFFEIHVAGSREMWIGLIGTLLGGMCTLIGVLFTIFKQDDSEEQRKRLDNQPIIGFELLKYTEGLEKYININSQITYYMGELVTSAFVALDTKKFTVIKISTLTKPLFKFVVEDVWINGEIVPKGAYFNPLECRIAPGEIHNMIFDYVEKDNQNLNTNLSCIIRFSYDDIFGNHYLQDLPINYAETTSYEGDNGAIRQIVEIMSIQAPQYAPNREDVQKRTASNLLIKKEKGMRSNKYDELVKDLSYKDAHDIFVEIDRRVNNMIADSNNPLLLLQEIICYIEGYQNRTFYYTYTSIVYGLIVGLFTLLSALGVSFAFLILIVLVIFLIAYLLRRITGTPGKKEQIRGFVLSLLKFKYEKLKEEKHLEYSDEVTYTVKVKKENTLTDM